MKTLFKVVVFLCLVFCINTTIKAQQYAIKSGYVEYQLTGNTNGTKKIWWDNYGVNSFTETKSVTVTKIFGMESKTEEHQISVMKGENFWSANLIEGTGQKGKNPYYKMGKEFAESLSDAQKKELERQLKEALNAQELGTENFLGRTCDVMSVMGAKSWIYKGVILKSDANVMGIHNIETALKFDEDISVPASKFTAPSGIEYVDMQEMEAMYYGGDEDYNNDGDDEAPKVPVKYPYNKFESAINGFSYSGYSKTMCTTVEGQHMAMFMQGMVKSLTIVATSKQNDDGSSDINNMEEFTHNGRKCKYGKLDDEDGTGLLIDYPAFDMYIVIAAMPNMSKDELVKISDKLNF